MVVTKTYAEDVLRTQRILPSLRDYGESSAAIATWTVLAHLDLEQRG